MVEDVLFFLDVHKNHYENSVANETWVVEDVLFFLDAHKNIHVNNVAD